MQARQGSITGLAVLVDGLERCGHPVAIEINDNPVRWFKASHEIRVADHVLNEHFAGTYDAFVVLTHNGCEQAMAAVRRAGRSAALGCLTTPRAATVSA